MEKNALSIAHTHKQGERERESVVVFVCSSQIITSWVCACFLSFFLSFSLRACCLSLDFLSLIGVVSSSGTGSDGWRGVGLRGGGGGRRGVGK